MKFINLLDEISEGKLWDKKSSRRESFGDFKNIGKKVALASIPFALAATSEKTKAATLSMSAAQDQASPIEVLQFALTLEYLERRFYAEGLDSGVIVENDQNVFRLIYEHEQAHVNFLYNALDAKGAAFPEPEFDFTAGGAFNPFGDYGTFLILSQGFEDTGVRAYKGQAGALIDDNVLLEYALQIHSVEARHASQVRRMRGEKGWITGNDDQSLPIADVYLGEIEEANTIQGGLDLKVVLPQYSIDSLTEAFDEPLTMAEVNAIAGLFIVS